MKQLLGGWLSVFLWLAAVSGPLPADDWPQWLGPQRDSVWRETGIVTRFPAAGLPVRWRAPIANGYSGPAVAAGKVYVMDYVRKSGDITNNPGGPERLQGTERVLCLNAADGRLLWKYDYDRPYGISFSGGPRCTPTVVGGRVFALGAEGNLSCLNAADGRVLWTKDFVTEYGAKTALWGVAAHPLVDGDQVYCVVGGAGSVAVAFDAGSGREIWRALSAREPGYCAPVLIEHGGARQLLIWHAESLNSLDPRTGAVHWSVPLKPREGMAIVPPRKLGGLLFASGFGEVAALLRLDDQRPAVTEVWRGNSRNALYCATVPPFLEDGMIYGCDINSGTLMGVRLSDGARQWQTTVPTLGANRRGRYGTAFLVKHDDRFFLFNEAGDLILAKLTPAGYDELGRFHVLEPTNSAFGRPVVWSHPAFAARYLFARNDKELVCVSLAAEQ